MSHVTFLRLVRRETLSLFVYRFARRIYHHREPLWTSARAELDAFIVVMIFIEAVCAQRCLSFWFRGGTVL